MAAFERIKSGIEELDETLDNIRLGDNVVWQVSNLKEFSYFVVFYNQFLVLDWTLSFRSLHSHNEEMKTNKSF